MTYPTGMIVGPCVCGSWPGGECLRCPRVERVAVNSLEDGEVKLLSLSRRTYEALKELVAKAHAECEEHLERRNAIQYKQRQFRQHRSLLRAKVKNSVKRV